MHTDVLLRHYTSADLHAGAKPQAILAGFTRGGDSWRQHHYLGRSTEPLPSMSWLDPVIPRLTEALRLQHALPRRAQETLECLRLFAEAYWPCLPIRGLKYGDSYLDRQVPGVQEMDEQTQAARTLAAPQQVGTPMVWSLTQQPGQTTAALIAPPFLPHGVHATTAAGLVPLLEGSVEPPVESNRMSGQPAKTMAQLHNPYFF
ncbi:hypothetical protein WJX77_010510 [Trebouxia sp. C0004]